MKLWLKKLTTADVKSNLKPPVEREWKKHTEYFKLNKCSELAGILSLEFNVEMSHCIAIAKW